MPSPFKLAGLALMASGCALTVSYFLKEVVGDDVSSGLGAAAVLTNIAGVLLLLLGLPAWYAAQAHKVPRLGLVAMLMVFTGYPLLELGSAMFASAMPGVQEVAPTIEELQDITPLTLGLFMFGLAATNLGTMVLGVVSFAAAVFPRPASAMVAVAPLLVFAPNEFPFGEELALTVGFLGFSWIGWSLVVGREHGQTAQENVASMIQ